MLHTSDNAVSTARPAAPPTTAPPAAYQRLLAGLTEPGLGPDSAGQDPLRCLTCGKPFDFAAGETALVLRHVAYYHDFAHAGPCLQAALEQLFPEPGYDCAAFSLDRERRRVLAAAPASGWAAQHSTHPRPETLRWWLLVQHADGSPRVEGISRDPDWDAEPGGASFPEASPAGILAYVPLNASTQASSPTEWLPVPALLAA